MSTARELLFQLYKKFYEQRSVLKGAPDLTIDINQATPNSFDFDTADTQLSALVSYLLGIQNIKSLSWENALPLVEKYYGNQADWQRLLLDYFAYTLEKEKEDIMEEQIKFLQNVLDELDTDEDDLPFQKEEEPKN